MAVSMNISAYMGHSFTLGRALGWWGVTLLAALLGAHFFRASDYGMALCCLGAFILHCGRAPWKGYAISYFLAWGAFEWAGTAFMLAETRTLAGMPWMRGALILLAAAFVTALGAIARHGQAERDAEACLENAPENLSYGLCAHGQGPENAAQGTGAPAPTAASARAGGGNPRLKGLIFIIVFCLLYYAAKNSPIPLLLLERVTPRWGLAQIFLMAWYGAFILELLLNPAVGARSRKKIWLLFSVAFFGQLAAGLLGAGWMLMTGKLHFPVPGFILFGPAYRGSWSMMLPLVAISALLVGSAWCAMLCYFGAFDLCAAGRKPVKAAPPALGWMLRRGRAITLAAGAATAALLGFFGAPMEAALAASALFICAGLLVMLFLSRKYNSMLHCAAFCPLGLAVNLLGRLSPWRMAVDAARCDNCGACERACRYRAISAASRAQGKTLFNCALCRDCESACKKGAVAISAPWLSPEAARQVFVALLVILHVLFLSFARV